MRSKRIISFLVCIFLSSFLSISWASFGANAKTNQHGASRFARLEREIEQLRHDINQLRGQPKGKGAYISDVFIKPGILHPYEDEHHASTPIPARRYLIRPELPVDHILHEAVFLGGTPIVSSPYIGKRSEFDGSDLVVNISSYNEDVRFLQQRQRLAKALRSRGIPLPGHPLVDISGKVQFLGFVQDRFAGGSANDFNLASAELDVAINVNRWNLAFISLAKCQ